MSVPVMSEGIRSGVNCTRLKVRFSTSASVEMSSVLARPGTPTNRQWPREKSAIRRCSTTSLCPTTRFSICSAMAARARARPEAPPPYRVACRTTSWFDSTQVVGAPTSSLERSDASMTVRSAVASQWASRKSKLNAWCISSGRT